MGAGLEGRARNADERKQLSVIYIERQTAALAPRIARYEQSGNDRKFSMLTFSDAAC
jgi:hypothetical protein